MSPTREARGALADPDDYKGLDGLLPGATALSSVTPWMTSIATGSARTRGADLVAAVLR